LVRWGISRRELRRRTLGVVPHEVVEGKCLVYLLRRNVRISHWSWVQWGLNKLLILTREHRIGICPLTRKCATVDGRGQSRLVDIVGSRVSLASGGPGWWQGAAYYRHQIVNAQREHEGHSLL